jgi:hypothetical protein
MDAFTGWGSSNVLLNCPGQPLTSLAVTVYVPAANPVRSAPSVAVFQENV